MKRLGLYVYIMTMLEGGYLICSWGLLSMRFGMKRKIFSVTVEDEVGLPNDSLVLILLSL